MAGQRQPIDLLKAKGKKHLTKAEIEERERTEIKAPADKVTAPAYLTPEQKKKFKKIVKDLRAVNLVSNLDVDALARLVIAQEKYIAVTQELEKQPPHPELKSLLLKLSNLRRETAALADGTYRELCLTNRQYAFSRTWNQETVVVAVNNDEGAVRMEIPCPAGGAKAGEILTGREIPLEGGKLIWEVPAHGSAVFRIKQG